MPQVFVNPPVGSASAHTGERRVFVYGTLRASGANDIGRLRPAPRWVGRGRVRGRLFHLGGYPGLLLGEGGWVQGEIYAVAPDLEAVLDAIEEVWPQRSGEYFKREVQVQLWPQPGDAASAPWQLRCFLYEIHAARTIGRPVIEGGDWMAACAASP